MPRPVVSTTPADQATNVAVDSNIVINFSESVTRDRQRVRAAMPGRRPAVICADRLARRARSR